MNFSLGRTYTYDYLTTVHSNEANSHASKDTQARHDVGVILEAKVDVTAVWKDGATSLLQIKVEKRYDLPCYMYGLLCIYYVICMVYFAFTMANHVLLWCDFA